MLHFEPSSTAVRYQIFWIIGPSGVRALPLAAGINEGGHYFGPSVVRAPAVSTILGIILVFSYRCYPKPQKGLT
jgi:hypothetical protein